MTISSTIYKTSFIVAVLLLPLSSALGYFTTAQHAFTLDNKTGIYLVEYKFGHQKHDLYMPIMAQHSDDADHNAVSFGIFDDELEYVEEPVAGIVISDAEVENGMYKIRKGTTETFTLFAVYTPDKSKENYMTFLEMTHVPFNFNGNNQQQLNPSEVKYYRTPDLALRANAFLEKTN